MRRTRVIVWFCLATACTLLRDAPEVGPGDAARDGRMLEAGTSSDVGGVDSPVEHDGAERDGAVGKLDTSGAAPDSDAAGAPSYESVVLDSRPLGYWRLDEATTPVANDHSGNGYHGMYLGVPTFEVPGPFPDANTAVAFEDEEIEVADFPLLNGRQPFTAEAWIRPSDVAQPGAIVSHSDRPDGMGTIGWRLSIDDTGDMPRLRASRSNENGWGTAEISATWHHVAMIYDGVNIKVYQDGAVVGDRVSDVEIGTVETALLIADATRWRNFRGAIDEVAIYDRALPISELAAHYQAALDSE